MARARLAELLRDAVADPENSFSIGSLGAIAEFHRDASEPLTLDALERLSIAMPRGALSIDLRAGVVPITHENTTDEGSCRRAGETQREVLFCLPLAAATRHRRIVLTDLGPDHDAIHEADRAALLFDLGLGALNVDFCIRTTDRTLIELLRTGVGSSLFGPKSRLFPAIVDASPARIAISALGRIEVYQPIAKTSSPSGPHTHVLPELLKTGRTHAAGTPVPDGYLPCLSLYSANLAV